VVEGKIMGFEPKLMGIFCQNILTMIVMNEATMKNKEKDVNL
jgi:hypothetical protein